jgi:hypothetical protein
LERLYQGGYGEGWRFAKRADRRLDYFKLSVYLVWEFLCHTPMYLTSREPGKLRLPFARVLGTFNGLRSFMRSHNSPSGQLYQGVADKRLEE